jgi:hypothetical protein
MKTLSVPAGTGTADRPLGDPADPADTVTAYARLTRPRHTLAHDDTPKVAMILTSAGVLPCTVTLEQYRRGGAS